MFIRNKNENRAFLLKNLGWAEMLVALLPILGAYYLGPVPFSFWILLLLSIVTLFKGNIHLHRLLLPLELFFVYWFVHELILVGFVADLNLNKRIEQFVSVFSILLIVPLLDLKRLTASLNLVSVICIIGLLYQLTIVNAGGVVHPLEIPGLKMTEARLEGESIRPSSFFMEPAAYTAYMYAPLMLSLINRKYWWSSILTIAMLLTTSTTAFFAAFIIWVVFLFSRGVIKRGNFIIIVIVAVLFYAFNHLSIFDTGREKLNNTDFETNVRIVQGPVVVSTMHWDEMIFGVPYGDIGDYYSAGRTQGKNVLVFGDSIYMSTTWALIFSFGIVGLLLYINVYYRLAKQCRLLLPYLVCLFVSMFTSSMYIGVTYVYTIIVLYVVATHLKPE